MLRTLMIGTAALTLGTGAALAASDGLTDTQPDAVYERELPEGAVIGTTCEADATYMASASAGQPGTVLIDDVYYIPCDNIEGRTDVTAPEQGTAGDAGTNENDG